MICAKLSRAKLRHAKVSLWGYRDSCSNHSPFTRKRSAFDMLAAQHCTRPSWAASMLCARREKGFQRSARAPASDNHLNGHVGLGHDSSQLTEGTVSAKTLARVCQPRVSGCIPESATARGQTKGTKEWKGVVEAPTVCMRSGGFHNANVQVYPHSTRPRLRVDYAKEAQF